MVPRPELERILSRIGLDRPASSYENQRLEFKEVARSVKETLNILADAAVCFANADGGTIVLGIRDTAAGRESAFAGAGSKYTVDVVRRGIFERTQPGLTVIADEHREDGVRVLIIDVPPGVVFHSNRAGLATRRLGTECLPFTPDQQRQVLSARGVIDWSAESAGVALNELDAGEIERLRGLLRAAGLTDLAGERDAKLLRDLRLVAPDALATRAAVLLLGTPQVLEATIPHHGYSFQFRPSAGSEATTRFRLNRPLLAAAEDLISAVETRSTTHPLNVAGGVQLQLVDYPAAAVREVVVNALVHRAYDQPGSVDVEQAPERLTVSSPGGLVPGVTPENILTHPSTPRHRLLFDVVSVCQLAERTGQGIDRAYREMLRMGKQPPDFQDDEFSVRALLQGGIGNDTFVRFVSELPDELGKDVEVLLALSYLRRAKSLNAQRLASLIQRTPPEAQDVLARLADERFAVLEPTRSTARKPYPTYALRPEPLASLRRALSYRSRTTDQIDEKVIEHIREYDFVTNRTLQRLFDVHVFAARDLLNDLRARGIIQKVGKARGGTGVRYEAGAAFPSDQRVRKN